MLDSIGSIWRQWDLHIHTPASYHWNDERPRDQSPEAWAPICKKIVERINQTDIDVFGVMDYWTFDGYFALRRYLDSNQSATKKTILPGIEFRLEAPTDFRLNSHVLFCDTVSQEALENFIACLRVGGTISKPPRKETFIEIAKTYDDGKLRKHGFVPSDRDDTEKMLLLGLQTALVTRHSLREAIKLFPREQCLVIQPYDTSDGLEKMKWEQHFLADSELMQLAQIFEVRNRGNINLFLGRGHTNKIGIGNEFIQNLGGRPKPCVSGSDAHRIVDYGNYPSDRITWLKAQPSFAGLQQVTHEPELRCWIGSKPPKLEHIENNPTKYMTALSLKKIDSTGFDEIWFDGISLELNPGLIAIIGNKGSGKSALADIIALTANSHCRDMEFLNSKRFRKGGLKAKHFSAKLSWADGNENELTLDRDPDIQQPERVRYLPQQFIEGLCNEIASGQETNFERELKKVIFSHVPNESRMGRAKLDDLLTYTIEPHRRAIEQLESKLDHININVVEVEKEMSEETLRAYRSALSLKQNELDAHEKTKPEVGDAPPEATPETKIATEELLRVQDELAEIETTWNKLKGERAAAISTQVSLHRLLGHIQNFETTYGDFVKAMDKELSDAGLDLRKIVTLEINRTPLNEAIKQVSDRLAEIDRLVEGSEHTVGLDKKIRDTKAKVEALRAGLQAPQKKYQEALAGLAHWTARRSEIVGAADRPDTIEFLKTRIHRIEHELPVRLDELVQQRWQLVRDIHAELLRIRGIHADCYKSVQEVASNGEFALDKLQLRFDAPITPRLFEASLLEYINRGKRGNFYGDDESRDTLRRLLQNRDFNKTEEVVAFLSELLKALTEIVNAKTGAVERIAVQSQLKANKKLLDLYNYVFKLTYLEPRYTLKLGDKDISQLSPGEKGALLLVFYLALDREEIPIIIDQPEQNLDNQSVVTLLVDCIKRARARRQVIIVTHNPNLAVVCDADQIVYSEIDKQDGHRITYSTGAIEDYAINKRAVDVLEGTYVAFSNRGRKYHKPKHASNTSRLMPYRGEVS